VNAVLLAGLVGLCAGVIATLSGVAAGATIVWRCLGRSGRPIFGSPEPEGLSAADMPQETV